MTATATARPVRAFEVDVVRVRRLSPAFLRVTLGGPALFGFDGCGPLGPRDLRVKLMLPSPGHRLPDLSDLSAGWYQRWLALDPVVRGSMRTYTARAVRLDGATPEIDIDFVLHGDGPASTWAVAAVPGDTVTVLGPSAAAQGYGGIEWRPPAAWSERSVRVLLVGDESAVPAVSSILESLPAPYHGHAVLEVPGPQDFLDVRTDSDVVVQWLARGRRARGEALADAVRQIMRDRPAGRSGESSALPDVDVDTEILWESAAAEPAQGGGFYAWIAGEASMVRGLRRHLVRDRGVDRRRVAFMGYWRQGKPEIG